VGVQMRVRSSLSPREKQLHARPNIPPSSPYPPPPTTPCTPTAPLLMSGVQFAFQACLAKLVFASGAMKRSAPAMSWREWCRLGARWVVGWGGWVGWKAGGISCITACCQPASNRSPPHTRGAAPRPFLKHTHTHTPPLGAGYRSVQQVAGVHHDELLHHVQVHHAHLPAAVRLHMGLGTVSCVFGAASSLPAWGVLSVLLGRV